jgi:hypothetical protein
MSYDLTLVRLRDGADLEEAIGALQELEESALDGIVHDGELQSAMAERVEQLNTLARDAIAAAAIKVLPVLEIAQRSTDLVELHDADEDLGISVYIGPSCVEINLNYWHKRTQASEVWRRFLPAIGAMCAAGGLSAYDQQLGRELDTAKDLHVIVEKYRSVSDNVDQLFSDSAPGEPKRPWWKFW